ncbi:three-Cys-motif partner protein TcmP [Rathayibacter soli]|uniref:three-Cys-motif partner protein TcmP n=1 Tax=Rathayibacter soli TaxID=3144168 RepID=UPI0027E4A070|nr:three-Cys-motif partner protein TcmP [Glaciibacter superstes]
MLKHELLRRYLIPFVTMTGSFGTKNVWLIDAYAGPGKYGSDADGVEVPGSPTIICDLSKRQLSRGVKLHGVFIEREKPFVSQLRQVVNEADPQHALHEVLEGDAEQHLGAAVVKAGSDPLLIFLDPFGTSLSLEVLCGAIAGRSKRSPTEILLNFNLEAVWRIGGLLTKKSPNQADEKTLARADAFLGGPWWRRAFVEARSGGTQAASVAATHVASEYQRTLFRRTGLHSIHVPIRRRPDHQPLFLLTLFYAHPAAPVKFVEAASAANGAWRSYNKQKDLEAELTKNSDHSLFPDEWLLDMSAKEHERTERDLEAEWVNIIAANIRRLLESSVEITLETQLLEVYGTTVTLAREKHLNRAWDTVAAEGIAQPRLKGQQHPKQWFQVIKRAAPVVPASGSKSDRPASVRRL